MAHRLLSFVLVVCLVCLCAVSSFAADELICADHNCFSSDPDAVCSMCLYEAAYIYAPSLMADGAAVEPAPTDVYAVYGYDNKSASPYWHAFALISDSYTGSVSCPVKLNSSLGSGINLRVYFNPTVTLAAKANNWLYFKMRLSLSDGSYLTAARLTGAKMGLYNMDEGFYSSTVYSGAATFMDLSNGWVECWIPYFRQSLNSHVSSDNAFMMTLLCSDTITSQTIEINGVNLFLDTDSITNHPDYSGGGGDDPSGPDYGEFVPLINWYNDIFGAAVSPEVSSSVSEIEQAQSQIEVVEDEIFSGITEYSDDVDPDLLSWPTDLLSAVSWIGHTFMGLYDGAGDARFLISVSMTIGICMLIIGRGGHAIVVSSLRGSSSSRIRGGKKDA